MQARIVAATLLICSSLFAAEPEDPAVALARILAAKGTITAAELSTVESSPAAGRVTALAAMLQRKGLLTRAEGAQFGVTQTPPAPQSAAVAPSTSTGPAQRTDRPVTTRTETSVSLYGTLLMNAFYNTSANNIQDIPLFLSKQGAGGGNDKNFGMTARQTRLGLRLSASDVAGAKLSGQFEFDLLGGKTPFGNGMDMDIFRLRLAYGRLDWKNVAVEAGQDWAIFAPLNPTSLAAFAIPDFSASGNPWIRLPQVRVEVGAGPRDGSHLLVQAAALDPNAGDYPTATFSSSRQPGIGERGRMPALETRVAWSTPSGGGSLTLGLSGHYDHGRNLAAVGPAFQSVDSWGVALDYTVPVSKFFNLTGEAFEGRALGIFSVTAGEAVGAYGTTGGHGVESRGGWTQGQLNFTKRWQMNLGYGLEIPNASQLPVGNRWRNQTYMANIMFKLNPAVTFAWEYRRILTDYRNQIFGNERGDHLNFAAGYIF